MQEYQFRCTTNRLLEHRKSIQESGDTILEQSFLGGRDWVLTCRKAEDDLDPAESGPYDDTIPRSQLLRAMELLTGRPAAHLRSVRCGRDSVEVVEFALDDEGHKQVANGKAILKVTRYGVTD